MISSVIPARLEFSCGHVALVSLPRLKGESATLRTERVTREKTEARGRACDFCGPREQALLEVRSVQDAVPTGDRNGHHAVDEKEKLMQSTETPSVTRLGADETRRTFPPRRRLNAEQELEVTRMYAETTTPVPEISKHFSIGESSVYRIAARHGAPLRGRVASGPRAARAATSAPTGTPAAAARPTPARRGRRARVVADTAVVTRRRGRPAKAAPVAKAPRAVRRTRTVAVAAGAAQRFQIQYRAETVVRAADVRAALRQVESLGATDVIAIVRIDR